MPEIHDVVVVGAGPGGSAAAYFLAQQGKNVLLVDKADFPRDKTCGDGLTPRALRVLREMGLLPEVEKLGWRINGVELHAANGAMMAAAVPSRDGFPNYLMILPRLKLDDLVRRKAVGAGAKFRGGLRVRAIEQNDGYAAVRVERNGRAEWIKARVVILATGANLRLLQQLGFLHGVPRMIMAARAYYEGMASLSDRVQAYFTGVPLPGYGWVFPLSERSANVGVGYWRSRIPWSHPPSSPRGALLGFLEQPKLKKMLGKAENSPIKGYPLRIDFTSASTYGERVLLVGEAAGLVSPLTGEGIDFALECGMLAAEFLEDAFEVGDFSHRGLEAYDRLLREHFQRLFLYLERVRRLYINPLLIGRAVQAAATRPKLKEMLVNVMMSHQEASILINLDTFKKIAFGW